MNAGVPSVEAVADEMPFASSQRLAQERRLPRMRRTPACQALQRWRPNAVRKFAAVRARTASADGVCRSPLRSARRRSTRRCVAPRRIARFAAEPLSRRPRAEGGAPNPQPASRDAGRPTSGRLVALGPNAGNAPDRAGGERGAEQHDHAALEHRERHALAEKERAPQDAEHRDHERDGDRARRPDMRDQVEENEIGDARASDAEREHRAPCVRGDRRGGPRGERERQQQDRRADHAARRADERIDARELAFREVRGDAVQQRRAERRGGGERGRRG
ncbi:hypothetical protein DO71_5724 [Burkholderia pseudomallei]|nr:hypothetical protein DO71_5724 [Burkholderia pseudomallei]